MTERSLQVTYRKGRTFAAYLHLSHPTGEKSARTVASPDGLLIVDYAGSGRPLGVEITAPPRSHWIASTNSWRSLASRPSRNRTTGPLAQPRRISPGFGLQFLLHFDTSGIIVPVEVEGAVCLQTEWSSRRGRSTF